jgi:hypothetical protein
MNSPFKLPIITPTSPLNNIQDHHLPTSSRIVKNSKLSKLPPANSNIKLIMIQSIREPNGMINIKK